MRRAIAGVIAAAGAVGRYLRTAPSRTCGYEFGRQSDSQLHSTPPPDSLYAKFAPSGEAIPIRSASLGLVRRRPMRATLRAPDASGRQAGWWERTESEAVKVLLEGDRLSGGDHELETG